ncbi:helix-turn-helix domain-containing protein [Bacillus weihaiensis]|uniref:helix-turn-helix domain-containing protein n=1 Tax=Bacillus weihaiensis TaxID=1547283 RepID=UPI002352D773|nr:helix-turn-helix transcriptional regulator [Bacillus weihaiensis]
MEVDFKTFSGMVKAFRTKRNINARDLSRKLGKGDAYISQIENKRIKTPDYETAYEILKHIGVDENDIPRFLDHYRILPKDYVPEPGEQVLLDMIEDTLKEDVYSVLDTSNMDMDEVNQVKQRANELFSSLNKLISIDPKTTNILLDELGEKIQSLYKEIALKEFNDIITDPILREGLFQSIEQLVKDRNLDHKLNNEKK